MYEISTGTGLLKDRDCPKYVSYKTCKLEEEDRRGISDMSRKNCKLTRNLEHTDTHRQRDDLTNLLCFILKKKERAEKINCFN
jgi:hypothetical protein